MTTAARARPWLQRGIRSGSHPDYRLTPDCWVTTQLPEDLQTRFGTDCEEPQVEVLRIHHLEVGPLGECEVAVGRADADQLWGGNDGAAVSAAHRNRNQMRLAVAAVVVVRIAEDDKDIGPVP